MPSLRTSSRSKVPRTSRLEYPALTHTRAVDGRYTSCCCRSFTDEYPMATGAGLSRGMITIPESALRIVTAYAPRAFWLLYPRTRPVVSSVARTSIRGSFQLCRMTSPWSPMSTFGNGTAIASVTVDVSSRLVCACETEAAKRRSTAEHRAIAMVESPVVPRVFQRGRWSWARSSIGRANSSLCAIRHVLPTHDAQRIGQRDETHGDAREGDWDDPVPERVASTIGVRDDAERARTVRIDEVADMARKHGLE